MFGAMSATQNTPQKKQEDKQTVVPVTARILHDAVASRSDDSADILIHGTEAGVVHLVGVVEAFNKQNAMIEFQLNDASGRIKIRQYTSGATAGEGVEGIASGHYVSVIGNLRTSPAVHVSAMTLKAVKHADEVSYHMIEVGHAACQLRKAAGASNSSPGGVSLSTGVTPTKKTPEAATISPVKVDAPPQIAAPESVAPGSYTAEDVRSSIITVLRMEQDKGSEAGLDVDGIVAKLTMKASSDDVRKVCQGLVEDGDCFTTINDDTFAML